MSLSNVNQKEIKGGDHPKAGSLWCKLTNLTQARRQEGKAASVRRVTWRVENL